MIRSTNLIIPEQVRAAAILDMDSKYLPNPYPDYAIFVDRTSTATGVVKRNSPTVPPSVAYFLPPSWWTVGNQTPVRFYLIPIEVSRRNFDDDRRMLKNAEQAGLSPQITITKTRPAFAIRT